MDSIISSLERTLNHIDSLDKSIQGEHIDDPQNLATKINDYVKSLELLRVSGMTMDSAGLFPVPIDLLDIIDSNGNPEEYLQQLIQTYDNNLEEASRVLYYLKGVRTSTMKILEEEISETSTNSLPEDRPSKKVKINDSTIH